jgi:hypothetical protein
MYSPKKTVPPSATHRRSDKSASVDQIIDAKHQPISDESGAPMNKNALARMRTTANRMESAYTQRKILCFLKSPAVDEVSSESKGFNESGPQQGWLPTMKEIALSVNSEATMKTRSIEAASLADLKPRYRFTEPLAAPWAKATDRLLGSGPLGMASQCTVKGSRERRHRRIRVIGQKAA